MILLAKLINFYRWCKDTVFIIQCVCYRNFEVSLQITHSLQTTLNVTPSAMTLKIVCDKMAASSPRCATISEAQLDERCEHQGHNPPPIKRTTLSESF